MAKSTKKAQKFTKASDDKSDRKAGIKLGSAKDKALDKKRGVK